MKSIFDMYFSKDDTNSFMHVGRSKRDGAKVGSGRYPLGSGKNPRSDIRSKKIAEKANKKVVRIEDDVKKAAKSSGSKMYGLEHKLKTTESINRKLNKIMNEENLSINDAENKIKDAVRFTTISSEKNFVSNYNKFKNYLEKNGYTETKCKNYFEKFKKGEVNHKAVQSVFEDSDGYPFEVQFQTKKSQDVKERKIPLYEEARKENISADRLREIEKEMYKMALEIDDPVGIEKIISHS